MNKEKTVNVTKKIQNSIRKKWNWDISKTNKDVASTTTSIIGRTSSSTEKPNDFYFFGVGAILLATDICAFLCFQPKKKMLLNTPNNTAQVKH